MGLLLLVAAAVGVAVFAARRAEAAPAPDEVSTAGVAPTETTTAEETVLGLVFAPVPTVVGALVELFSPDEPLPYEERGWVQNFAAAHEGRLPVDWAEYNEWLAETGPDPEMVRSIVRQFSTPDWW